MRRFGVFVFAIVNETILVVGGHFRFSFFSQENIAQQRRTAHLYYRNPMFCCRRPTSVEFLAIFANRTKTVRQSCPVQEAAIKDSFVWVMGPQRFVTLTSCKLAP